MIDINNLDKYDYSDTSTARELIYKLYELLNKSQTLNKKLIDYVASSTDEEWFSETFFFPQMGGLRKSRTYK